MTLNNLYILVIYKKYLVSTLVLLSFVMFLPDFAFSAQSGDLQHNDIRIDYSKLNKIELKRNADLFFNKGFSSVIKNEHDKYLDLAMNKYYVLTKIEPLDIYPYVQLARIYDDRDKHKLAKEHFFKATNIDAQDPYANYYFGEFYFKRRNYNKALAFYNVAYNNGYNSRYELNLRLATIYEKFADLANAKHFYEVSYSMKPDNTELLEKINLINGLKYEKSEYYHVIRE